LMVRKTWLSWRHSGSWSISADLPSDEGQQLVERGRDRRFGDEALLIQLCGADFRQLAQAGDQSAQLLLAGRSQAQRHALLHLGIPGDHASVNGVGLFQPAHALGKLAHRARVEDGDSQALLGQLCEGLLLITAGRFHGHQFNLMCLAEGGQCDDALGVVGERGGGALVADAHLQRRRTNIHSTNGPCHGNLPCMCD
jgi:hypothetical protein